MKCHLVMIHIGDVLQTMNQSEISCGIMMKTIMGIFLMTNGDRVRVRLPDVLVVRDGKFPAGIFQIILERDHCQSATLFMGGHLPVYQKS